jgi:Rrf2 family protein
VPIGEVAKRQGVSVKYLEKLIRELKQAGLIKSKRGPNGGHQLSRPAEDITLGDVVAVLEDGPELVDCAKGESTCPRAPNCLTRSIWMKAAQAMYSVLHGVSIADMCECCENGQDVSELLADQAS